MNNCLIVQSGGPTAVVNSILTGIIEESYINNKIEKIYGAYQGIYGLLNKKYVDLSYLTKKELNFLGSTPGASLGSWRKKVTEEEINMIITHMNSFHIKTVYFVGGNGTMQLAHMINQVANESIFQLKVIGIPNTIDNDIVGTEHTPGYGSAAKFLNTCVMEVGQDLTSLWDNQKITIIESMGRNTGWLAASTALAKNKNNTFPNLIYIPEIPFSKENFLSDVQKVYEKQGYALIVVSEGLRDEQGEIINNDYALNKNKTSGLNVGGVSAYLSRIIEDNTKYSSRYISPGVWQRTSMRFASRTDIQESYRIGQEAVRQTWDELSGKMITISSQKNKNEMTFNSEYLDKIAGYEKKVPKHWYDKEKKNVTEEFINYVFPLIQGEVQMPMEKGVPIFSDLLH